MVSIFDSAVRSTLERRVRALRADSPRQWGRMSAHEAVCHMSDAFKMAFGEKAVVARPTAFRPMLRFIALRLPMKWPRGVKTLPEVQQGCGGTTPIEFERDRTELLALLARFSESGERSSVKDHPIFGPMSTAQWGSWGYRHMDHHLRQFGV